MVNIHDEEAVHHHMLLMAPGTVAVILTLAVNPLVDLECLCLKHHAGQGVFLFSYFFFLFIGQSDITMRFKHGDLLQTLTVSSNLTLDLLVFEEVKKIIQRIDKNGGRSSLYFCTNCHEETSKFSVSPNFFTNSVRTSLTKRFQSSAGRPSK